MQITATVGIIIIDIAIGLMPVAAVLAYQHLCNALVVGVSGIDTMPDLWTVGNLRVGTMAA